MRWIWMFNLGLSALLVLGFYTSAGPYSGKVQREAVSAKANIGAVDLHFDQPFPARPDAIPFLASDSREAMVLDSLLAKPPSIPLNDVSSLCHLLLAYRDSAIPLAHLASSQEVFSALTDYSLARKQFGEVPFFDTRYGVRYQMQAVNQIPVQPGESHRDLCLATFGEIGLPLSCLILTPSGTKTIRDLLNDSMATFDVHEAEIAWTAIAYALYASGQSGWTTRNGEHFSFNDLATELLSRPLSRASCGGAHVLMAMTLLLRVDATQRCISPGIHRDLIDALQGWVRVATTAQCDDGSWIATWYRSEKHGPAASQSLFARMLVTGHLLEWLEYLPSYLQPDQSVYRGGVRWLMTRLPELAALKQFPAQMFCPWTHSISAIRNLVLRHESDG